MNAAAPLILAARIVAAPGRAQSVEAALRALVAPTRTEEGCELYDLHRDLDDSSAFVMLERWRLPADWEAHNRAPHVAAFLAATQCDLAAFEVTRLTMMEEAR
jgi:quinol monooxygenase YgiN